MIIIFHASAWNSYVQWQHDDAKIATAINDLVADIRRDPFRGIGKPEPLKHELAGWWARRITREHRLVYRMTGSGDQQRLEIAQCRFHY